MRIVDCNYVCCFLLGLEIKGLLEAIDLAGDTELL